MGPVSVAAAASCCQFSVEQKKVAMNNSIDFPLLVFITGDLEPGLYVSPLCTHTDTRTQGLCIRPLQRHSWVLLIVPCHCQWRHELHVKSC